MADIFNEIDDDLRRDQLKKLWDRFGVLVLVAAALIVVGVAGWRGYLYWQERQAAAGGDAYYAAMTLLASGDEKGAQAALEKLAADGSKGYVAIARLHSAALAAKTDRAAGIAAYESVARQAGLPKVLTDLAWIQAGYLALDSEDENAITARMRNFLGAGEPFRHSAREILVLSAMKAGNWAEAGKHLDEMLADAELPQSFQRRAEILNGVVKANQPLPATEQKKVP